MTVAAALAVVLVAVSLVATWFAGRRNTSADTHLVAGGTITPRANGVAIAGDYISASTFLGVTGAIALTGFNGFYLAVFVPVAYVVTLLVVAGPLRNLGRYTLADVVCARFPERSVRVAMGLTCAVVNILFLVSQLVGAALLTALLFGTEFETGIVVIALLTVAYTAVGGMYATTWIQICKTVLLAIGMCLVAALVLGRVGSPLDLFDRARELYGPAGTAPTRRSALEGLGNVSQTLGLVLGVAGLPHVMTRFLTVPDSRAARRSALTALWIFSGVFALLPVLGYGAAVIVGRDALRAQNRSGTLAMPQLAAALGGEVLLGAIAALAFVTLLAVLAGLVISTTGALAHDLYGTVLRGGRVSPAHRFVAARVASVLACSVAAWLALGSRHTNVAVLAALATTVAAAATLPALVCTIYCRTTTARSVVVGMGVGVVLTVGLILAGPVSRGEAALFPLVNPAIVSVPVAVAAFLVAGVVTHRRLPAAERERADQEFSRTHRRALSGPRGTVASPR